ncbi:MAG: tandem-95 repeat protein [Anaerolineae bacterium]|nr:tandem-95 repeat protein [Anaerolineae bacterium]
MNTQQPCTRKAGSIWVVVLLLVLTTLSAKPARVALAANTGWHSPTADVADTGGDNDGFEVSPTYAFDDGGNGAAESRNTCTPGTACTERHRYDKYGLDIPAGVAIQGIEVRADWWLNGTQGANSLAVDLSWDGGASWTGLQTDTVESTTERTAILGGTTNTWGRTWSPGEFSDATFVVRVNIASDLSNRTFYLDWIAVQVTYNQAPNTPTNQTPASAGFTAATNPAFGWSAFSDLDVGDTQAAFRVQLRTEAGTYGGAGSKDSGTVAGTANTYTPTAWNLAVGTYCWHVRVQDSSGTTNAWSAYSADTCFTIERTAPTSTASSPDYDTSGPIVVDWTADDDVDGSGIATVALWYRLGAGAWTNSGLSQTGSTGSFDFAPPGGTDGIYSFQTVATDVVGNVESGPTGEGDDATVYDATPPTSQATPPAGPVHTAPIAIPWTANGAVSGIATDGILLRTNYNGGAYADGPTASGTSGTFDFSPSDGSGTYCFYTIATDNAGNVEAAPGSANGDGCTLFNTLPVAVDDGYAALRNTPLTVDAPGVLGNDSDGDGDTLTATLDSAPASGTLALAVDGSFVYTPTLNMTGVVTFTYHANDGLADSNRATVTITVKLTNVAPVAVDDSYSTAEDTVLTVAAPGVLGNDSDDNGDPLTAILQTAPANGTLTLKTDGSLDYTPAQDWSGVVTFTYYANDGTANSVVATVAITVTPDNDAPTFSSAPVVSASAGARYTYHVIADDVDDAATDLVITAPTRPAWLTLTDNGDGTARLTGIPTAADIGSHDVVLQVSDGAGTTQQPFTIEVSEAVDTFTFMPVVFRNR